VGFSPMPLIAWAVRFTNSMIMRLAGRAGTLASDEGEPPAAVRLRVKLTATLREICDGRGAPFPAGL
jgi:hypothetical protein